MTDQLIGEALLLCSVLCLKKRSEMNRRDGDGYLVGDEEHIARLDRLWRKASDRWRRRAGYE